MKSFQWHSKTATMVVRSFVVIVYIILAINIVDAVKKRNYAISIDSVNYTIHQQGFIDVQQFTCGRNVMGQGTFTLHVRVQRNVTDLQIRDNLYFIHKGSNATNAVHAEMNNTCEMLRGNYDNNYIKLSIIELQQVAKPPLLCPLIKNTLYTINNYTLRPNALPPYLPLLSYAEKIEFSMNGVHFLDLIFEGKITKA